MVTAWNAKTGGFGYAQTPISGIALDGDRCSPLRLDDIRLTERDYLATARKFAPMSPEVESNPGQTKYVCDWHGRARGPWQVDAG